MLVSIIIPCFNVEAYIEECLESAYKQTYTNIEIICVDNNSTDNTSKVILALKDKYPLLILSSETKEGAAAARNKGLKIAKGEWIQFLDADDLLEPSKIEHQIGIIKKQSDKVCFLAGAHKINSQEGVNRVVFPNNSNAWTALAQVELGNTCSNLFNGEYLSHVRGWNENLKSSQEYDLMFRLLKVNPFIVYDMEPLTIIRRREGSITTTNIKFNLERRIQHLASVFNHIKSLSLGEHTERKIAQALFEVVKEFYRYNSEASLLYLQNTVGKEFIPSVSPAITSTYLKFHKAFGYHTANKILKIVKGRRL